MNTILNQLRQIEFDIFQLIEHMETTQLTKGQLSTLQNMQGAFFLIKQARETWDNTDSDGGVAGC